MFILDFFYKVDTVLNIAYPTCQCFLLFRMSNVKNVGIMSEISDTLNSNFSALPDVIGRC